MKSVSDRYKKAQGFGFSLSLEAFLKGERKTLSFNDLLSFKLSGNGSSDELLSFGFVSACEVTFSIDNIDGQWDSTSFKDVEWTLKMGKNLSWTESEDFQIGVFKTQEALVSDGAINIKAIDNMHKFEVKFKGINYPCTIRDLIKQCCNQCGVIFRESSHPNLDVVLDGAYQLVQITCRKVISLAAEICGCFAIINPYGELELRWFDTQEVVYTYDIDNTLDFKPSKDGIVVGGASVTFNGRVHSFGSGTHKITLTEDNRLLMFSTDDQIHMMLEALYNSNRSTFSYNEASFSAVGDPALEIGDVIQVKDKNGVSYKILVSGLILSNNLKMEIVSPPLGDSDDSVSSSTESGSIPRESSEAVTSHISKNDSLTLEPRVTIDDFLYQRFSAESNATPLAMIVLSGTCTSEGILTLRVVLDAATYIEYKDKVTVGPYLKTIILPIEGLVSGNHTLSLQLISDESLRIIFAKEEKPTAGSTMILQGRKLGDPTSWDGVINVGDSFGSLRAGKHTSKVHFRESLNDIVTNDYSGAIVCETVKVKLTRKGAKLSIREGNFITTLE